MSFFSKLYDGVINLITDSDKKNQDAQPEDPYQCKDCEKTCSMSCNCRCHAYSCESCDQKNCDIKACDCNCHTMTEGALTPNDNIAKSSEHNKPDIAPESAPGSKLAQPPNHINQNITPSGTSQSSQQVIPASNISTQKAPDNNSTSHLRRVVPGNKGASTQKSSIPSTVTPNITSFNAEKQSAENKTTPNNNAPETETNKVTQPSQPIEEKLNRKPTNQARTTSVIEKETSLLRKEKEAKEKEEEKKENSIRRPSKYSAVINHEVNVTGKNEGHILFSVMKGRDPKSLDRRNHRIITFRSKSREKKEVNSNLTKKRAKEEKMQALDDPEYYKQKTIPLNLKMKTQFDKIKLADLKVPEKLDNYVDEKFIRDKSDITKNMEKLTRELRQDNYSDKNKLALNIFEDFEKQESWQSYTTLLFADLSKADETEKKKPSHKAAEKDQLGKTQSLKN